MVKELLFSLRKDFLINGVISLLVGASFVLLSVILLFGRQVNEHFSAIENVFEGIEIFQITDDVDVFELWDEPDALERVRALYHHLNHATEFTYITVGGQPLSIPATEFRGDIRFKELFFDGESSIYIPGEGDFHAIKSLQMNQNAFTLVEKGIRYGRLFEPKDFEGHSQSIPVILGGNYAGIYEIGDIIHSRDQSFEVIGILEINQTTFNYHPTFFLDDYIIVPNIRNIPWETPDDKNMLIFRYLQRLYGFILVDKSSEAFHTMADRVGALSSIYEIPLRFWNMDDAVGNYNEIRILTHHQSENIHRLFFISSILICLLLVIISIIRFNVRRRLFLIHKTLGIPKWKQLWVVMVENCLSMMIGLMGGLYYLLFHTTLLVDLQLLLEWRQQLLYVGEGFLLFNIMKTAILDREELGITVFYSLFLVGVMTLPTIIGMNRMYRRVK